jgi:hypothetical protein
MPLRIDRVDTELEVMRSGDAMAFTGDAEGGAETLDAVSGKLALKEKLRPLIMEILHEELLRIQRKVGSPL